jgi:NADH:ubiquinone oxidoreductase subunit 5 (subunit L)/multisubunit Na+/H+ antiporter MnhA subunit
MRYSGLSPDQLPALRDRGLLGRRFFWDDAYQALVVAPAWSISGLIGRVVEPTIVVGGVDAAATMVRSTGQRFRALQSGFVRSYSLLFAAAALLALVVAGLSWR